MKILYIGCHLMLEHQEVKLLTDLGHEVFSLGGAYQNSNEGNEFRPSIPNLYKNEHLKSVALQCSKENIHPEILEWADIIFMTHNARVNVEDAPQPWLDGNWKKLKDLKKPIIWRSIGQSSKQIEQSLKKYRDKIKIVRYSPKEETIPDYQGADAMIRFYVDPDEFKDYQGTTERIVNVSQALYGSSTVRSRGDHMNLVEFKQVVQGLPWKVFGPDNENAGENNGGVLSYEDLKSMLQFNRVYLYTGTRPASYTLGFMDALMTGIPIVSIGPTLGNSVYTDQKTFEIPDILGASGEAGFWSDSPLDLKDYCKRLLADRELAIEIGKKGRAKAMQLFSKQLIMDQWKEFLSKL